MSVCTCIYAYVSSKFFFLRSLRFSIEYLIFSLFPTMVYRFSLNDENYRINGQRHEGKREAKVQFSWGGGGGGGGGEER